MKYASVLALAILTPSAWATDLTTLPSEELCVLFSLTLATGEPTYAGNQQQIKDVLNARSEECKPADVYMQAALQRARNLQAKAQMDAIVSADNARAEQMSAIYEQQAASERSELRRRALQDFSNRMLNPPKATTTSCQSTLLGMDCTTR